MAGDLLPASLYVPYINMLTGLANNNPCAHHCYNLLKINGMYACQNIRKINGTGMFTYFNLLKIKGIYTCCNLTMGTLIV